MADPTKYKPHFNYSGWEAAGSKRPKPGADLDTDFADIARSIDETIDALKDIRRSDGKLVNGLVDMDAMEPGLKADFQGYKDDAETARDQAQQARNAAQSAQSAAEDARDDAQTARTVAVNARNAAQTARSGAESARDDAQDANTAAQGAREGAEQARDAAENLYGDLSAVEQAKTDAQSARSGAETARDFARDARDEAQAARDTSVQAKDTAVSARDRAETARDIAEGFASDIVSQGNVPIYNSATSIAGETIPEGMSAVRINGNETPADRGGGLFVRAGTTEPEFGPKIQDASGVWFFKRTPPLNVRDFGVKGSDNESTAPNETAAFLEAIKAASALKIPLQMPGTNYLIDGIRQRDPFRLYIEGDPANKPVILCSQAAADGSVYPLDFRRNTFEIDNTISITEDVKPNQKKVKLSDVSGLSPGMMIQWCSDKLWHYDSRGTQTTGEIHLISRVLEATNQIEVDDHTRDFYDISDETLTIRAWWPDELILNSIKLWMPPPSGENATRGILLDRVLKPQISDVEVRGPTFFGIQNWRSWLATFNNIECENIGQNTGYGIQERSTYGTRITGLKARSLRRAVDFHSLGGDQQSPSRDWLVQDFIVNGGGTEVDGSEYWPEGSVENYGLGMHGPSEGGVFRDGIISNVREGVTVRGRNTEIRNVRFMGRMLHCIGASFGTGLVVEGCTYEAGSYPDKISLTEAMNEEAALAFVRLGVHADTGFWNYNAPTVITNNTAYGLKNAFLRFDSPNDVRNLTLKRNTCIVRPPAEHEFNFVDVASYISIVHVLRSFLDRGSNDIQNYGDGGANFIRGFGTIRLGDTWTHGLDAAVQIGPLAWALRMGDDTVGRIERASPQSDGLIVSVKGTAGVLYGVFALEPNSATLTPIGTLGSAIVGTATPSALTGTAGEDGKFTIGLSAEGDLWMENRTGNTRRVYISIQS